MNLPARIVREAPAEPVVAVDGTFGARGLNLSHWPGNTTPAALRHELSTGSALLFARLAQPERERLAAGAALIANNHYDTDGVCSAFAVRWPAPALARERELCDAARAGDFFEAPSRAALALDALVHAWADPARSPLGAALEGLADHERWTRAQDDLLERLPALLDGGWRDERALWEPEVRAIEDDQADLAAARREELPALGLCVWTARAGEGSRREASVGLFDPGRHALFGASQADRALAVGPLEGGATYRLVVSTRSWFERPGHARRPRPDLEELARRLDALEGTRPEDELAWRAQPREGPAPELWFGEREIEPFAEHNGALQPSELEPERVREIVQRALAG